MDTNSKVKTSKKPTKGKKFRKKMWLTVYRQGEFIIGVGNIAFRKKDCVGTKIQVEVREL